MDLGFVSNAVALHEDGWLPERPWFLIELDSPAYGAGGQVAPSTIANYNGLAAATKKYFPEARWAAHGQDAAGYAVIERALADGSHIRVGFEDAIHLPDGRLARSNAELVAWAVEAARKVGRMPATLVEARLITGCNWPTELEKSPDLAKVSSSALASQSGNATARHPVDREPVDAR